MSTLRTNTLKTLDDLVTISVADISKVTDYANETDPTKGAILIGYKNRTVAARLLEHASIFDFMSDAERADALSGAPVLDHTAAVQAAFAAIGVTTRNLEINDGASFRVLDTSVITSKSAFKISGKGQIRQFAANKRIVSLTSCTDFEIEGPRFYGLGTDYVPLSDTSLGDAIFLTTCDSFYIYNCKFTNFGYSAIRTRDCNDFSVRHNKILGTHGITSAISYGDIYQFGVIIQTSWNLTIGSTDFEVSSNRIRNTAMGIRTEPLCRRFGFHENIITDMKGEHAFYINGQDFSITSNILTNISFVGVKMQSFWNALGPFTDPIKNATVTGNTIDTCQSGIHVEKTHTTSLHSNNVVISGNQVFNASAAGEGILVEDCGGLNINGNTTTGGRYGIIATTKTTGEACSGLIHSNTTKDSQWSGIFGYSDEVLSVSDNTIIRPNIAAAAGNPQSDAVSISGTSTSKRVKVKDNTLFVDTSTGVVTGLQVAIVALDLGANDWDTKPISTSAGATIRKRTPGGDYVGLTLWGSAPLIATGASATKVITVTGAAVSDFVTMLSHGADLQGCTINASITSVNTMTVVITNNTGSNKTISDAFVRWAVGRFAA